MSRALIVVDYQNDFVTGSLGFDGAETIETEIVKAIQIARSNHDTIIFTFDTHQDDYLDTLEGKGLPIEHCLDGTSGWALYGEVANQMLPEDMMFCKNTYGSSDLLKYLETKTFTEVCLVGLVSYICVISNAVLAKTALPQARIVVDASATTGPDPQLHQKALAVMQGLQIDIINADKE